MSSHIFGTLMVGVAALCWSSAGLAVRLLEHADGWTTTFWRSTVMAVTVLLWLLLRHGRDTAAEFRRIGRAGVMLALSFASTFIFFILALDHTTVANTVVIMSATPLFAGIAASLVLAEPISRGTLAAMLAACAGITLMVADSLSAGHVVGDLLALGVALTQALNVVILRRGRAVNLIPALCLAGAFSAVAALPFATPAQVTVGDLGLLVFLGAVQLGLGLILFSVGVRHLPVAAAGLLSLLETVLSPLWAWLGVGERPGNLALLGGAMVILTLAAQAWTSARRVPGAASPRTSPRRGAEPHVAAAPSLQTGATSQVQEVQGHEASASTALASATRVLDSSGRTSEV
jgi:drug/metabolite transporter (DMT)-like permease